MFLDTTDLTDGEIILKLHSAAEENKEKGYVPAYYFKIHRCIDDAKVGTCDLRIGHNDHTYYGGNIGYGIYEEYRGNHFAGKACKLLFKLAKKHQMNYLMITCDPTNWASRKTCEYTGCKLKEILTLPNDNEMYLIGETEKCIYYIDL